MSYNDVYVVIGFFDGFHKAHSALFAAAARSAAADSAILKVITFNRHKPDSSSESYISPPAIKEKLIRTFYPEAEIEIVEFDPLFAEMSPKMFVEEFLRKHVHASKCFVGEDFRFGKDAAGNANKLAELIPTVIMPILKENGEKISTTSIKTALNANDFSKAVDLLGHPYLMGGMVQKGDGRGHLYHVATINLPFNENQIYPQNGVYSSLTEINGVLYPSVTNIGSRPTFYKNGSITNETHILNQKIDLYGKSLWVWLCGYLRGEIVFDNSQLLYQQIEKDMVVAEKYLNGKYLLNGRYCL